VNREDAYRLLGYRPEETETPVKPEPKREPPKPHQYLADDGNIYEVNDHGPDVFIRKAQAPDE